MKTFAPTKEMTELVDWMTLGFISDVQYQFSLDNEKQAVDVILKSLTRQAPRAVKRFAERSIKWNSPTH